MRSRLVMLVALAVAAAAIIFTGFRVVSSPSAPPAARATLPHRAESYLGVYETGAPPAYHPVTTFASAAASKPNLVGYFSGWAEPFQSSWARQLNRQGQVPYVQIDPTYASVAQIADGVYDRYLRSYADSVRDFRHPVVIGFGLEMNAPWYPWGYGRVPAATFVAAWRHIVTLFRSTGADNVTWLWTINADQKGTGPIKDWWPGAQYVSWVGIDGFYYRPADSFKRIFGRTIAQVHAVAPGKSVLIAETAVGPAAGQFVKIGDLFHGVKTDKLLGLVWFDIDQHDGHRHQDWRIEGSQTAEAAFRLGVADLSVAGTG